jgi:hypothetical protein
VDNSAVTQPVSGTVSVNALPAGSNTIGGIKLIDTGGTNAASISAGGAVKVDNSGVTQPVSGTITANIGTTNGLALDTSVNGVIVAQASTTSGQKGPLVQGAVTTGSPTYTTAQTSPISLTTAGAVRVDASATTQPANITQVSWSAIAVGSNAIPVLNTAATGYVSVYGSNPSTTGSATDVAFKWGAGGTTQVNHLMIQNNTAINVSWDLDVATSAGSPILTPGQAIFLDVQTTALHLQAASSQNINGTSANNIVVRGWL